MPRRTSETTPTPAAAPPARPRKRAAATPKKPSRTPAAARPKAARAPLADSIAALDRAAQALRSQGETLSELIAETPRAAEFQPLADHLYEFAQGESVRALQAVADTLEALHERFSESMLRLPRAEDYEPLAEPLRHFARVSPSLLGSLEDVTRVAPPVLAAVSGLQESIASLQASHQRLADALALNLRANDHAQLTAPLREFVRVSPDLVESLRAVTQLAGPLQDATRRLDERSALPGTEDRTALAQEVAAVRATILEAVAALPREPEYEAVAAQLRELATVSPSLMDWLRQVPTVGTPLAASVRALLEAASKLQSVEARLRPAAF